MGQRLETEEGDQVYGEKERERKKMCVCVCWCTVVVGELRGFGLKEFFEVKEGHILGWWTTKSLYSVGRERESHHII